MDCWNYYFPGNNPTILKCNYLKYCHLMEAGGEIELSPIYEQCMLQLLCPSPGA